MSRRVFRNVPIIPLFLPIILISYIRRNRIDPEDESLLAQFRRKRAE
jgi:hypothetical protein